MPKHWYAVHTFAGYENKVKTSVEHLGAAKGLSSYIYRIEIPTEQEVRTRNGKKYNVQKKLFPGYILIEMDLTDETWHLIRSIQGVTGFVTSGDKPVPLQDAEIASILEIVDGPQVRVKVSWQVGENIRVVTGPFTDFHGTIDDVMAERDKLRVLISLFGRDTPVELDFNQVEKIV
ncbi:MAG: transcription termination/antitermination protein NusG [Armatimonadota bacterium]